VFQQNDRWYTDNSTDLTDAAWRTVKRRVTALEKNLRARCFWSRRRRRDRSGRGAGLPSGSPWAEIRRGLQALSLRPGRLVLRFVKQPAGRPVQSHKSRASGSIEATMASPQQFDTPPPSHHEEAPPRVLRLRLVPWDVAALLALLVLIATLTFGTDWYARLFGFLKEVCAGDCPSAPFGVDFYIYPLVYGGIGAAVAAALLGPVVSLLKGWYLSFWPALAIVLVLFASAAGTALTDFSLPYWHEEKGFVQSDE
jgi:hypothetical protein